MAAGRIAPRVREANEFAGTAAHAFAFPVRRSPQVDWTLEKIVRAVDAQMRGDFGQAVELARSVKRDDAMFTAFHNRVSPINAIAGCLKPYAGVRGERMAKLAAGSVFAPRTVLQSIVGTLADHGVAIGYVEQEPNDVGTWVDFRLTEWPLEFVHWDVSRECLRTRTRNGPYENIVHADGRWIVFKKFDVFPWQREAAILPGGLVWAGHAFARADWAGSSKSHGLSRLIGQLAQGYAVVDATGKLTKEASGLLSILQDMVSGEASAAVYPFGAKIENITDTSTNWQVFSSQVDSLDKAASRIYLGTDAPLGATGGAPGVNIEALFKIAAAKIQGDFQTIADGLNTGLYQPWAAWNDGDSRYAPCFELKLPDPDADAESEEQAARFKRLTDTLKAYSETGLRVDHATIDAVAERIGVSPAPTLAYPNAPQLALNAADANGARTIIEIRAAQGLAPLGDDRDTLTVIELTASAEGRAKSQFKATSPGAVPAPVAGPGVVAPPTPAADGGGQAVIPARPAPATPKPTPGA
jgi:phage gp29-like protein